MPSSIIYATYYTFHIILNSLKSPFFLKYINPFPFIKPYKSIIDFCFCFLCKLNFSSKNVYFIRNCFFLCEFLFFLKHYCSVLKFLSFQINQFKIYILFQKNKGRPAMLSTNYQNFPKYFIYYLDLSFKNNKIFTFIRIFVCCSIGFPYNLKVFSSGLFSLLGGLMSIFYNNLISFSI